MDDNKLQQLRPWVAETLGSVIEADVDALTEYVLALLKQNTNRDQLRQTCNEQLTVFLQDYTSQFVDAMFQTMDSLDQQPELASVDQMDMQREEEPEYNGQAALRSNFRADRDQPQPMQQQQQQHPQQMVQQDQPGFWNNGIFVPYPSNGSMPMPTFQGFVQPPPRRVNNNPRRNNRQGPDQNRMKKNRGRSKLSSHRPEEDELNRYLIVERLPEDKFNQEDLQAYFSNFGTVKETTLHPRDKVAELEFETHQMAKAAYESPAPIFDNRFVKVFWKTREVDAHGQPKVDLVSLQQLQARRQQEFEQKREERAEQEAKKKQMLLQRQAILKKRQEQEELRRKLAQRENPTAAVTEEQAASSGEDQSNTEALKRQLAQLRSEAQQLGVHADPYPSRGRGGFRGRGGRARGGFHPYAGGRGGGGGGVVSRGNEGNQNTGNFKLDLRPTAVLVENVGGDKEEAFKSHLLSVGEVENVLPGDKPQSTLVQFKNRYGAEQFFFNKNDIDGVGQVKKSWYRAPQPAANSQPENIAQDQSQGQGESMDADLPVE